MLNELDSVINEFLRNEIGGIMITDTLGNVVYKDPNVKMSPGIRWGISCPGMAGADQMVAWDYWDNTQDVYLRVFTKNTVMNGDTVQIHLLIDIAELIELYHLTNAISVETRERGERDGLTGLNNKGKYLEMMHTDFPRRRSIAILNLDVNDLKKINDGLGHEAGDKLLKMAADSIKAVCGENVYGFRIGGDEFLIIAVNKTEDEANELKAAWERALEKINRESDAGFECVVACGMAYGVADFSYTELAALADRRMYEDKKQKKHGGEIR